MSLQMIYFQAYKVKSQYSQDKESAFSMEGSLLCCRRTDAVQDMSSSCVSIGNRSIEPVCICMCTYV